MVIAVNIKSREGTHGIDKKKRDYVSLPTDMNLLQDFSYNFSNWSIQVQIHVIGSLVFLNYN